MMQFRHGFCRFCNVLFVLCYFGGFILTVMPFCFTELILLGGINIIRRTISIIALMALFWSGVISANPHWSSTGPYGGQVSSFAFDPVDSRIVFAINHGIVYWSIDEGATWQRIKPASVYPAVVIRFASGIPKEMFLGTPYALYHSSDLGNSWIKISDFSVDASLSDLRIYEKNPKIMYAAFCCGLGVLVSIDGGINWAVRSTGLPSGPLEPKLQIDHDHPETAYVALDQSVYKTENGGLTWTQVGKFFSSLQCLEMDPRNGKILYTGGAGCLYKTSNAGHSWFTVSCNVGGSGIAIVPAEPQVLYVVNSLSFGGEDVGVLKSTDAGGSWTNLSLPPRYAPLYTSVAARSGVIFVGSGANGVFRSVDSGLTWHPANRGMNSFETRTVALGAPGELWAIGENAQLYHRRSSSEAWSILSSLMTAGVEAIAVHPKNPKLIALEGDFDQAGGPWGSNFALSTNGGVSWKYRRTSIAANEKVLAFDPTDENTIFIVPESRSGYAAGIAKSTDQGSHWRRSNKGLVDWDVTRIVFDPQQPSNMFVLTGNLHYIYKSVDKGESWTYIGKGLISQGETPLTIAIADNSVFALTLNTNRASSLFVMRNGQSDWEARYHFGVANVPFDYLVPDSNFPHLFYVGSSWGKILLKSSDTGGSWQTFPHPPVVIFDFRIDPLSGIHVGTDRGVLSFVN